jgi:peroxiredoxin Q/BCP
MKRNFSRTTLTSFAAIALLWLAGSASLAAADMPKAGDKAPLVEGRDQDGKMWSMANDVGKKVLLLYFYPKDDTPGCTKEACGFRDSITDLKKQNVEIVGVSYDSEASHQKFITKYNLNFPLIADTDGKIATAYGVKMDNRNMAKRVSFLIGLDGKIVHVTNNPKAEAHLDEMKAAAAKIKA